MFGRFLADKENRDELSSILLEAAEAMGDADGCEVYQVSVSNEEPQAVYVYEVWKDEAAHRASLTLDSTQTLIRRAKPLITGMERLNNLQTLGGKNEKRTNHLSAFYFFAVGLRFQNDISFCTARLSGYVS